MDGIYVVNFNGKNLSVKEKIKNLVFQHRGDHEKNLHYIYIFFDFIHWDYPGFDSHSYTKIRMR